MTVAAAEPPRAPLAQRLGTHLASYGGFIPAIVLLGLFFLVPLGIVVCYSFWETIDYCEGTLVIVVRGRGKGGETPT